jgi:hypothetical protein
LPFYRRIASTAIADFLWDAGVIGIDLVMDRHLAGRALGCASRLNLVDAVGALF